jgi:OOP family OmpA-OmpF porin
MASVKTKVWDLAAVGTLPIADKFSAYGKLGLYRADSDLSSDALGSSSEKKDDWTYGLGVQYDVNRSVGVRGEWQRYAKVGGDNVGGEQDIDVYGVAVVYRFK